MICLVYDYFFPAYKAGGPIQSLLNLIVQLKDELPMEMICSNRDHDGTVLNVQPEQWTVSAGTRVYYTEKGFGGIRNACGSDVTVLFINGIYSLRFNFLPALKLKQRKIVSVRGMLHPGALSQKKIKKQIYLQAWKFLGLHRACEYHATSEEEKAYIKKIFGQKTTVWVVPNLPNILPFQDGKKKRAGELVLCTIALISPMKNHLEVLRGLKTCTGKITYNIYGPVKDPQYWSRCEKVIGSLPVNITVKYHGGIPPADIPGVLSRSDVFIQPSKSENFGHSLFEALTSGVPLITSHNTPWNELAASKAGQNVSPDDEAEIANAISLFCSMDGDEFENWKISARKYAIAKVDVEYIKDRYKNMFLSSPASVLEN